MNGATGAVAGRLVPSTLWLLALTMLVGCTVAAQGRSKYVGRDVADPLALFLLETESEVSGALMLEYGLLMPFEGVRNGDGFSGELLGAVPSTEVSGRLRGGELLLTISQGDDEQEFRLFLEKGETKTHATPLLRMLALVPDGLAARLGSPGVSYVDYRVVERAAGIDGPQSASGYRALTEGERTAWSDALRRIAAGPPELLMGFEEQIERLPELLGFEWFDIDRALIYGMPPESTTLVAVEPEAAALAARLRARGFEERVVSGMTAWHKGEDGAPNLAERDLGDPFDGNMGRSQRISLLDGHLVNSAYWSPVEAAVRAAAGDYPSLAQSPDYRTLAEALEDANTGELLQAVFLNPAEVGLIPADPAFLLQGGAPRNGGQGEPLPLYGLAALADKQLAGERVGLVALLYRDLQTAEQATAVLEGRLAAFSEERFPQSNFSIDASGVHQSDSGLFAAVVSVRSPAAGGGEEDSQPGFGDWLRALTFREFYVLDVSGAP